MTLRPCLECGRPSAESRCPECAPVKKREQARGAPDFKAPPAARGYDEVWRKLSTRARRMQPFCSECGATTDLQCDHSAEAWRRRAQGLPVRLRDVDVVCGACNRRRGRQRPI